MVKMQEVALTKFAWTCMILQICFAIFFLLFVRYGESADATHIDGHKNKELEENIEKYPGRCDLKQTQKHGKISNIPYLIGSYTSGKKDTSTIKKYY